MRSFIPALAIVILSACSAESTTPASGAPPAPDKQSSESESPSSASQSTDTGTKNNDAPQKTAGGACTALARSTTDVTVADVAGTPPALTGASTIAPGRYVLAHVDLYPSPGGPNASEWASDNPTVAVSFDAAGKMAAVTSTPTEEYERGSGTYTITNGKLTAEITCSEIGPVTADESVWWKDAEVVTDATGITVRTTWTNTDGNGNLLGSSVADEHYVKE
jgi:hypothetical protein